MFKKYVVGFLCYSLDWKKKKSNPPHLIWLCGGDCHPVDYNIFIHIFFSYLLFIFFFTKTGRAGRGGKGQLRGRHDWFDRGIHRRVKVSAGFRPRAYKFRSQTIDVSSSQDQRTRILVRFFFLHFFYSLYDNIICIVCSYADGLGTPACV